MAKMDAETRITTARQFLFEPKGKTGVWEFRTPEVLNRPGALVWRIGARNSNTERRLAELEKKLDRLIDTLKKDKDK